MVFLRFHMPTIFIEETTWFKALLRWVAREIAILFILFSAFIGTVMAAEEAPDTVQEVAWWTDPLPVDIRRSRAEVVTAVKSALDDAGIEIPFPYRTLTFKESLRTKVLDLSRDNKKQ